MWDTIGSQLMVKAVETAVKQFFDWRGRRDRQLASIGLAVGYYYNFIDPLLASFAGDKAKLFSMIKDGEPPRFHSKGEFKLANVRMQIIIPSRLDDALFSRCEEDFGSCRKGFFYSPHHRRYLGVNYSIRKSSGRSELTIVDLARTLMAVKRYYQDFRKIDPQKELDAWRKIEAAEITAFKESLRWLLSHRWKNQLDFKEPA